MKTIITALAFGLLLGALDAPAFAEPVPEVAMHAQTSSTPDCLELAGGHETMEIENTQARAFTLPPAPSGVVAPPSRRLIPGGNTIPDSYWAHCLKSSRGVRKWVENGWLRPGQAGPDLANATDNPDGGPNPLKDGTIDDIAKQRAEAAKEAERAASTVTSSGSGTTSKGKSKS